MPRVKRVPLGSSATVRIDDWFLTAAERGNPATTHRRQARGRARPGRRATRSGRSCTARSTSPSCSAASARCEPATCCCSPTGAATRTSGWPRTGPTVADVFCAAAERGVDGPRPVWRSHWDRLQFSAEENRHLGEDIVAAGGQCLLDMRVRAGGSHHMKLVVLRHPGRPEPTSPSSAASTCATAAATTPAHRGDPQRQPMAAVYGERPPWHDVQAMIRGPAVGDVEAVFRERWEDPLPMTLNPVSRLHDLFDRQDDTAQPAAAAAARPRAVRHARGPAAAHLPVPAAATVRAERGAQHRPRLPEGPAPGAVADLPRGPVPLVGRRRRRARRGAGANALSCG